MGFNRRTITISFGGLVIVIALIQLVSLLSARIEAGDTLPPYSTMRADPLGTMAIFNALEALPQYNTVQYVRPFNELPEGEGNTLIIAGAGLSIDPILVLDAVDEFTRTGGRVVIAFAPMDDGYSLEELRRVIRNRDRVKARERMDTLPKLESEEAVVDDDGATETVKNAEENDAQTDAEPTVDDSVTAESNGDVDASSDHPPDAVQADEETLEQELSAANQTAEGEGEGENASSDPDEEEENEGPIYGIGPEELKSEDISERWHFDYGFDMEEQKSLVAGGRALEPEMRLRSGLYFQADDPIWTAIYARPDTEEGHPPRATIIERTLGSGTIVLCSDAYFLSNEALRQDRSPAAIQWLVGDNPTLLFSEVHLGNGQRDRIMTLVRRYRLHGLMVGLALLAGLFIWRNATTLLPRRERMTADLVEIEKSRQGGLDNLLVRFVPPPALITLCAKEWRQHFGNGPNAEAVEKLVAVDPDTGQTSKDENEIVSIYNDIAREVRKRNRK